MKTFSFSVQWRVMYNSIYLSAAGEPRCCTTYSTKHIRHTRHIADTKQNISNFKASPNKLIPSRVVAGRAEGELPRKFYLPEIFLFVGEEIFFKNKICSWKSSFWGNLGAKLKFWAPMISSVGNLQLCVGKLLLLAPLSTLFNPRRRCYYWYWSNF